MVMLLHALAARGLRLTALLYGEAPTPWAVYPAAVRTAGSGRYRYFFHVHDRHSRAEVGHFHLFDHGDGRGPGSHLIGLAIDGDGLPVRLFATNPWVTAERPCTAALALRHLGQFAPRGDDETCTLIGRYLGLVLAVFMPQVRSVLEARDQRLRKTPRLAADRRVPVLSARRICLRRQFRDLDRHEEEVWP
ncbi:hypothetical protein ABSH63_14655 [Sinimarinibacterium sp. HSW-8]|uniref:DUF6969 domain-containing protein n=1 Tax=Sinimarinibacterium thermocellulolyticum TaxID=3170016 RepID=A0ABV2ADC8_9GAMM